MIRTQIYLTETQRRQLDRKARAAGVTMATLIRRAIDRFLGGAGEEPDRQRILDETLGALPELEVPSRSEWDRA